MYVIRTSTVTINEKLHEIVSGSHLLLLHLPALSLHVLVHSWCAAADDSSVHGPSRPGAGYAQSLSSDPTYVVEVVSIEGQTSHISSGHLQTLFSTTEYSAILGDQLGSVWVELDNPAQSVASFWPVSVRVPCHSA